MRRHLAGIVLIALLSGWLLSAVPAAAAVTAQEWRWIEAALEKEKGGDLRGAMELWAQLLPSLKTHDYAACGNTARKLGRALDQQGRYVEAIAAFDDEFYCFGQLGPEGAEGMLWDQRRAEQIRPEIRLFAARPSAPEPTGRLAKHEPAFGAMLGGPIDKDPAVALNLSRVVSEYGKGYSMVLVYARWNEELPTQAVQAARQAGAALQVGWEPTLGLASVTDGTYVRAFARSLREYGNPVFLRFAAEMNGAWTPWHGDPAQYKAKFALVARIMREEAPNVAMVWSPNYVGDAPWEEYYPGDENVDWVGINLYHDGIFAADPSSQMMADIFYQGQRSNPLDKMKKIYQRFSKSKPIMISETGFGWATRKPYASDQSKWAAGALRRFYGYLPLLYPRIKAVAYFNVDTVAYPSVLSSSHYVLSGHPLIQAAYKEATASGWYLGSAGAVAPEIWRPVEQVTLQGRTRIAAHVNLGDPGVRKVEYFLDGTVAAAVSQLPWEAEVDFSGLSGEHTLTVRAYDGAGNLGVQKEHRFDASAIKVNLNGRILDFDQPPVNLEGRVLVPARVILEALGAEISWEASTRTVVATRGGSVTRLQIDNPVPTRNGAPLKALDVPAKIIGGRTLVPARFVAENFEMVVRWDPAARTAIIESP